MIENTTLCLTIGRRPGLLAQTLESMGPVLASLKVIAVNDFGDKATNDMFQNVCPHGTLISFPTHQGHHAAIDAIYQGVKTDYIFHCEDDWAFSRMDFFDTAYDLLKADVNISAVCLRDVKEFKLSQEQSKACPIVTNPAGSYRRLDGLDAQWHGYTFNPSLVRKSTWQDLGRFSKFKKERHVSRALRAQGKYIAYLDPSACTHIGEDDSVANPHKKSAFRRLKAFIRGT